MFLIIIKYCRVLYTFEAIDDTTLSVAEGENLKILQMHDDNMNDEWWLVEKVVPPEQLFIIPRNRGYVPSNYVEPIYKLRFDLPSLHDLSKDNNDHIELQNDNLDDKIID